MFGGNSEFSCSVQIGALFLYSCFTVEVAVECAEALLSDAVTVTGATGDIVNIIHDGCAVVIFSAVVVVVNVIANI